MIAEWFYEVTCVIGGSLNNSLGFERSPQSDILSGITFLWMMLFSVLLIAICFAILGALEVKENEKLKREELKCVAKNTKK